VARQQGIRGRGAGRPNAVDAHVGARLRQRRTLLGLSQEKLGEAIGLTFQQVQKYERGTNRISASRLYDLSQALEIDVNYFFDDMPDQIAASGRLHPQAAERQGEEAFHRDPMSKRETLELVRAYYRIERADLRKRLFEMTKAIAAMKPGKNRTSFD